MPKPKYGPLSDTSVVGMTPLDFVDRSLSGRLSTAAALPSFSASVGRTEVKNAEISPSLECAWSFLRFFFETSC